MQKRNSELSLNLHDEIKQKLKIFKRLKATTDSASASVMPYNDCTTKTSCNTKRKLSTSALATMKKGALKLSFDLTKSPKSLSRKGSIIESNHCSGLLTGTMDNKSPLGINTPLNLFAGRRDRKRKPTNIVLNFEDDLKRFFNGYFSSKQAFMSTNNSLNKSLGENRRGRERINVERQLRKD